MHLLNTIVLVLSSSRALAAPSSSSPDVLGNPAIRGCGDGRTRDIAIQPRGTSASPAAAAGATERESAPPIKFLAAPYEYDVDLVERTEAAAGASVFANRDV